MLSASKLCQSVSTSGPSATVKPMPTNTSSRRPGWVTRWRWPRRRSGGSSVRSRRSASSRAPTLGRPSSRAGASSAASTRRVRPLSAGPRPCARRAASAPSSVLRLGQLGPLAEQLGARARRGRRAVAAALDRHARKRRRCEGVDVECAHGRASKSASAGRGPGEGEGRCAVPARLRRPRSVAAVGLDEAAADPEAEAEPGRLAGVAPVELREHRVSSSAGMPGPRRTPRRRRRSPRTRTSTRQTVRRRVLGARSRRGS